jgi:DNA-binding CsgD family transcriptional regulator
VTTLAGGGSAASTDANGARCVSVVLGRFPDLLAQGLVNVLREDPSVHLLGANFDNGELNRAIARDRVRPATVDEAVGPSAVAVLASGVNGCGLENGVASLMAKVAVVAEAAVRSTLESARSAWPHGVLVVAHDPKRALGMLLLSEGVTCLADNVPARDLLAAVHLVARGGRLFAPRDGQRVEPHHPEDIPPLTHREMAVLRRVSAGWKAGQIALALGISTRTVEKHMLAIRRKLRVPSARDLIGLPVPCREIQRAGQ